MKTLFKKENLKNTILTTLYLILGILLCVIPLKMFNFAESALCFIMLIAGVICILIYSLMSADDKIFKLLIFGILGLGLGLLTILVPRAFRIILSLVVAYSGVSLIILSVKEKKQGMNWISDLVVGIVVSVLSIVGIILSGTNAGKRVLAIFFGIIFLINGVYTLLALIKSVKQSKENSGNVFGEQTEEKLEDVEENQASEDLNLETDQENQKQEENQEESKDFSEKKQESDFDKKGKKKVKNSTKKNYRKSKKKR